MNENIHWTIRRFEEFDINDFHDLIKLRIEVFVIEQDCPYQELDGLDRDAWHLTGTTVDGDVIACSRILPPGRAYKSVSFGRVITKQGYRNKGVGFEVVERTMAFIKKTFPNEEVKIGAQEHLESFYNRFGFTKSGEVYLEDGIAHMPMVWQVNGGT